MTAGIVVFARMDSRRLPGKVLMPLAGRPLLRWTVDRCRLAADLPVMLATSDREVDSPLAGFAAGLGLPVFRGDVDDVLGRALAAAEAFGLDTLVRISADSPFIDPELIAHVAATQETETPDLTTNVFPRSFPPGISAEAVPRATLARIAGLTDDAADREHVTRYVYSHPDEFRIANVTAEGDYAGLHLAVDDAEDYARAAWIAERLSDAAAGLDEIAGLARQYDAFGQTHEAVNHE